MGTPSILRDQAGYEEIGFTRTGGLAEYVVVPARQVHVLPPDASFEQAALLEPTSVVAHAFLQKRPLPGDTVVVVGDGTIGLLTVQIAHLFNPTNLFLLGSRPDRLELGRQLGATHMLNSKENDPEPLIHSLTGGRERISSLRGEIDRKGSSGQYCWCGGGERCCWKASPEKEFALTWKAISSSSST